MYGITVFQCWTNSVLYLTVEALRPDVANVMGQGADAPSKENLYNTPEIPSIPMKTFYNRGNHGVAPYATTTLISNPHEAHGSGNAFRPINADHPQNSGSGESGRGQGEMNWGNDSSTDNSRSNMGKLCHVVDYLLQCNQGRKNVQNASICPTI